MSQLKIGSKLIKETSDKNILAVRGDYRMKMESFGKLVFIDAEKTYKTGKIKETLVSVNLKKGTFNLVSRQCESNLSMLDIVSRQTKYPIGCTVNMKVKK